jgi:hypothetical protein
LFIKYPGQVDGSIEDGNVEINDIAPTIAEVVGVGLSWKVEGVSLRNTPAPSRGLKRVLQHKDGTWQVFEAKVVEGAMERQLKRKLELFGTGNDPALYTMNDSTGMIGKSVASLAVAGESPYSVRLKYGETLENVDLRRDPLPCLVRGRILGYTGPPGKLRIAVALNGRILAMTRDEYVWNWPMDELVSIFAAMLPEPALQNGKNHVELFLVTGENAAPSIHRIPLVQ